MEKKKSCNCLDACPCYPNCDQALEEGQIAGRIPSDWLRQRENLPQDMQTPRLDRMQPGMARMDMARPGMARADMPRFDIPQPDVPIGRWGLQMTPAGTARGDRETLEEENARDWQKLKEQYPEMARHILAEVEQVCDSMEYEGSMMFDSLPDKVRVRRLTEDLYARLKDRYPLEEKADQDDLFAMNQEGRRRYPPGQNWLSDFIQVLLYQEMFQRRCRHRGCRRW